MTNSVNDDIISLIGEFARISDEMEDPHIDEALRLVVKMVDKPDATSLANVTKTIIKLEALASEFAYKATLYKGFGKNGTPERLRKDMYYTAKEATQRLVDALKYVIRVHEIR